jgi:GTPase SAR1 family protein
MRVTPADQQGGAETDQQTGEAHGDNFSDGALAAISDADKIANQPLAQTIPDDFRSGISEDGSYVSLADRRLTSVPRWLGNLTALTSLDLSGNQLTSVPDSFGNLTALTSLDLSGNPLQSPLSEMAQDGAAAVKAYLRSVADHRTVLLWKSKLLVVGEGAVGKTSLIKSLSGQPYDANEPTTHGIRIVELVFNHPDRPDARIRLSSWDFGGQDIYHATHQLFLSDRSLFVLLWNARQGWEQAKLVYWLSIIKARAPHARVILVGTHISSRPADLPLTDLRTSFPQIVASTAIDNSTGVGINKLRRVIAEEAAKLPLMGSHWPATWMEAAEAIATLSQQYATVDDLHRQLAAAGVTDGSHRTYLLRALHLLGDIMYFDEEELLRDMVILRPQWVSDYIDRVLDSPQVADGQGLLTRTHEEELWSDLDPALRDRLLLIMEKFDLSYRIADDLAAASLVVERLPWEAPPYQEQWDAALDEPGAREVRLRYQLNLLPPGIPTWFIAREHRFSTGTHWRSGALLRHTSDPRVFGLIRAERQETVVDLAVRGPIPQLFFSILQDGLESILRRYQGLEITRLVPCTCEHGDGTQRGQPCRHMYRYEPLLRRMEMGLQQVECELSFAQVNIAELLFGIAPTTTDQLMRTLEDIRGSTHDARAQTSWVHREFLKNFRHDLTMAGYDCPSVFTIIPAARKSGPPDLRSLELRLYCEQPGAFHPLPEAPYIIHQPTNWLPTIGPYLKILLTMLKHTPSLVGPILGLSTESLVSQLQNEIALMEEIVSQLPPDIPSEDDTNGFRTDDLQRGTVIHLDYGAVRELLHNLDPANQWSGLSRVYTPEGEILWLCRNHADEAATLDDTSYPTGLTYTPYGGDPAVPAEPLWEGSVSDERSSTLILGLMRICMSGGVLGGNQKRNSQLMAQWGLLNSGPDAEVQMEELIRQFARTDQRRVAVPGRRPTGNKAVFARRTYLNFGLELVSHTVADADWVLRHVGGSSKPVAVRKLEAGLFNDDDGRRLDRILTSLKSVGWLTERPDRTFEARLESAMDGLLEPLWRVVCEVNRRAYEQHSVGVGRDELFRDLRSTPIARDGERKGGIAAKEVIELARRLGVIDSVPTGEDGFALAVIESHPIARQVAELLSTLGKILGAEVGMYIPEHEVLRRMRDHDERSVRPVFGYDIRDRQRVLRVLRRSRLIDVEAGRDEGVKLKHSAWLRNLSPRL